MTKNTTVSKILEKSYEYGFSTNIESEKIPKGINESVIRLISEKNLVNGQDMEEFQLEISTQHFFQFT